MKLKNRHIFKMVRLIKTSEIKEELIKIYSGKDKKDAESLGIDLLNTLIAFFSGEENEELLYEFIADVAGKTVKEIEDMYIEDTKNLLKSIAAENNLKVFFQAVSSVMKEI